VDSETRMQFPLVERAQKGQQTSKLADDVFCRDANVLRVRGALAFTDASKPGAGAVVDPVIMSHFCRNILR
jgi:hypothetical protein